jgi:hypothetical protein
MTPKPNDALVALTEFGNAVQEIVRLSSVACKNRHSLSGHGYYGEKFHAAVVELVRANRLLKTVLSSLGSDVREAFDSALAVLQDPDSKHHQRQDAARKIAALTRLELAAAVEASDEPKIPATEPVLPSAVLRNSPKYLRRILLQANGSYLEGWFDASAVMLRRLVESLVIELYERTNRSDEIRKDGEYLMLAGLVGKLLAQPHWTLSREVRRGLPELKLLGDRSAHTRHYLATRPDIDSLKNALRVTTDFLVHQAGLDSLLETTPPPSLAPWRCAAPSRSRRCCRA